jgi:branched-chain amino acid aminotransferase
MQISIERTKHSRLNDVDLSNIPFGKVFTDHMFQVDYEDGTWKNPRIIPFGDLQVSPALSCMHYGQALFEGMKAARSPEGDILLFRPEMNHARLNRSAERLCMPTISEELFMDGLYTWLAADEAWVPEHGDNSLYIRPFMIATDDYLGVKPSSKYSLIIYGCPVGKYYSESLKIKIETHFVRAVKGGVGAAKAAGNYAASLYPASLAQKEGYHQLLWTDALEHKYIEELGTSNFFALIGGKLYTPNLDGTILEGITRLSILKLAENKGIEVVEGPLEVEFLVQALKNNEVEEAFATGTAATIAPIGVIGYQEHKFKLPKENPVSSELSTQLNNIKVGRAEDLFQWTKRVPTPASI